FILLQEVPEDASFKPYLYDIREPESTTAVAERTTNIAQRVKNIVMNTAFITIFNDLGNLSLRDWQVKDTLITLLFTNIKGEDADAEINRRAVIIVYDVTKEDPTVAIVENIDIPLRAEVIDIVLCGPDCYMTL